ncbi:hypothetical protein BKP54_30985 [Ensifer sp. 1H6]|nr:hypothetical protein BKP54_30985 [Ensifer sp. 1H6]
MYRSHQFLAAALDFTDWQNNTQKPWFCYFQLRPHARQHELETLGKSRAGNDAGFWFKSPHIRIFVNQPSVCMGVVNDPRNSM